MAGAALEMAMTTANKMLGLGVMLSTLSDRGRTSEAVSAAIGKTIRAVEFDGDILCIALGEGGILKLWDGGQSCCEHRYMKTDDDLSGYAGDTLVSVEIADGPCVGGDMSHEVQFLVVRTNRGVITVANHNEHNGYYGGFDIRAAFES